MIRSVTLVVRLSDPLDCRPIAYNTGCCKPQRSSYRDRLRGIHTRQSIREIINIFCASKINRFKEKITRRNKTSLLFFLEPNAMRIQSTLINCLLHGCKWKRWKFFSCVFYKVAENSKKRDLGFFSCLAENWRRRRVIFRAGFLGLFIA